MVGIRHFKDKENYMKVGIQKVHENEWLVQFGCAVMRLDRFSLALLNITLEHMLALEHGENHSTLKSYVKLGLKLKQLSPTDMQTMIRHASNSDLVILMALAKDPELNDKIFQNVGGILAKQMESDLLNNQLPDVQQAKEAIKRLVEKMFELDSKGQIEFIDASTQYI
jgi:hypothetical protein